MKLRSTLELITCFLLTNPKSLWACSICFYGAPDQKANVAARMAIITLLSIVTVVLSFFIRFIFIFRKRAKSIAERDKGYSWT